MFRTSVSICLSGLVVAMATCISAPASAHGLTERVSVTTRGAQANSYSSAGAKISADGRFVVFSSHASNLVPGDTNGWDDVFVRDRVTDTTQLVSIGPGDIQGNQDSGSYYGGVSADGRYVAFTSRASNLVSSDTNESLDAFVRDRQSRTTVRVSLGHGGAQGDRDSYVGSISADGRYVAFFSGASNLVPGDTNRVFDVFVRNRVSGTTERVSMRTDGRQGNGDSFDPALSADGRFVAFSSDASNLVPGDTNDTTDIFVHDRRTGTTELVSRGPGGRSGNAHSNESSISADGRFIAFTSAATNLVPADTNDTFDIFVRDRKLDTTARASVRTGGSQSNGTAFDPAISADGRFVTFTADASNLISGDTNNVPDVFVRDRKIGTTRRVSISTRGVQGYDLSFDSAVSADGHCVAFYSGADNFVPQDTNGVGDIFVRILSP